MNEIEYKFLVDSIPVTQDKTFISQFYIQDTNALSFAFKTLRLSKKQSNAIDTVRIRESLSSQSKKYYLTAKTKGDFIRQEYEKEIPENIALALIKYTNKTIKKVRSSVTVDDLKFEFDFYFERADRLKICEIEVKNDKKYAKILKIFENYFKIQARDVTCIKEYKNFNLAKEIENERIM